MEMLRLVPRPQLGPRAIRVPRRKGTSPTLPAYRPATDTPQDQESSSEDSMHAYALKMWGTVSKDENMAARYALSPPPPHPPLTPPQEAPSSSPSKLARSRITTSTQPPIRSNPLPSSR